MRITSLVENTTKTELKAKHGLSLYIETDNHRILFDLGPDKTLYVNAKKRNIDLTKVDTVIISHGHTDHGGALKDFLKINTHAKVYVQRRAFDPHYTKALCFKISVGIDSTLKSHPQVVLLDGDYKIDEELLLFTVSDTQRCYSSANDALFDKAGKDTFSHEQNLIVSGEHPALIMGCGHAGVVNVMEKAKHYDLHLCVGGFHLFNPVTKETVPVDLLKQIAAALKSYPQTQFYTCHCTGKEAFSYLSKELPDLCYLACGESIER